MEIKINSYQKQSTLISSIIFFILGSILFTNPEIFITTISKIVGIILLIIGLLFIGIMFFNRNEEDGDPVTKLITAIFFIFLAVLFLFFSSTVEKIIRLIVGFWILFCGINRLIIALKIANKDKRFFSLIIISLLLIGVGIYTMIIGDVVLSTIGLILMIYSAIDIIGYIFYAKESSDEVEINDNITLISSNEEKEQDTEVIKKKRKKAKKIKDVKAKEE